MFTTDKYWTLNCSVLTDLHRSFWFLLFLWFWSQ